MAWDIIPNETVIEKTAKALTGNGIKVIVVENGQKAKEKALALIQKNASVMTATSTTSDQIGLSKAIDESENFVSLRKKITSLPEHEQRAQERRINSAPDYVIGSVHAITQDGHVLIASNSGSQLPSYVYSAKNVIWVAGAQKIVKNTEEGIKRIYEYTLKLETERMKKAYGIPSNVSKILIINKEVFKDRITLILIKEVLGF